MKKLNLKILSTEKLKTLKIIKIKENIENCLTDNKKINIDRLLEYRIEIRNAIDETERNIEMRASYAFLFV